MSLILQLKEVLQRKGVTPPADAFKSFRDSISVTPVKRKKTICWYTFSPLSGHWPYPITWTDYPVHPSYCFCSSLESCMITSVHSWASVRAQKVAKTVARATMNNILEENRKGLCVRSTLCSRMKMMGHVCHRNALYIALLLSTNPSTVFLYEGK